MRAATNRRAETGAIDEYGKIEETMAPQVLERVSSWIRERSGGPPPPKLSGSSSQRGTVTPPRVTSPDRPAREMLDAGRKARWVFDNHRASRGVKALSESPWEEVGSARS